MLSKYEIQANDFARKYGVTLKVIFKSFGKYFPDDKENRHIFKLKLSRKGRSYTFNFGQSVAAGAKAPTMYDVLTCLTKSDPGSYEDFCSEYGYDLYDENIGRINKVSKRTYNAVSNEFLSIDRLFSDILEELQEIQ